MAKVASISVELDLDSGSFTTKIGSATASVTNFHNAVRGTDRSLLRLERGVNGVRATMRDLVLTISHLRGALFTLHTVSTGWMAAIVQQNAEMERMTKLMEGFSTASSKAAREQEALSQVDAIRKMAKTAPYDMKTLLDAAVKFKSGGLDPMNGSLQSLTDAVAAFGGTPEKFHRASIAIQQMAGKGVVSMEELRQQLGEAVPTAMNLMARGMGMSMAELTKRVSTGTVEANTAIEKMLNEMRRQFDGSAQEMMNTFTGQMALFQTNLNELLTTSDGMKAFFEAVKTALKDLNSAFENPAVKRWADDLGHGLADVVAAGRKLVAWVIEFRREIVELGKILFGIFVARTVVNGVLALGTAVYNMVAVFRTAAISARALGLAVAGMLGPISIAVAVLYELANAAGLFGNGAAKAAEDIEGGFITDRAVETVRGRAAEIRKEIEGVETQISALNDDRNPGAGEAAAGALAAEREKLERLNGELSRMERLYVRGSVDLERQKAVGVVNRATTDVDEALGRLKATLTDRQLELDKAANDPANKAAAKQKEIQQQRLAATKDYYAAYTAELDAQIKRAEGLADSAFGVDQRAGQKLLAELKERKRLIQETMSADLATQAKAPVYFGGGKPPKVGGLNAVEGAIAAMAGRLADLQAEATGANGELEKLNAQIAEGKFKGATAAQLERLRALAGGIDETTRKVEAYRKATQALAQIDDKAEGFAVQARMLREALAAGATEVDPQGFRTLIAEFDRLKANFVEGTPAFTEASAKIKQAMTDAATVQLGQMGIDFRARAREITYGLMEDQRQARVLQTEDEIREIGRQLDLYESFGGDRKLIEADVQAYIRALRDQTMRANETQAEQLLRSWRNVTDQLGDASAGWLNGTADALTDLVMTGKGNFRDLANSIIKDIVRISIQAMMARALSPILGGLFGAGTAAAGAAVGGAAIGPGLGGLYHAGGIAGEEGMMRLDRLFGSATRYHGGGVAGLKRDEVPAVLRRGEGVFTEGQMDALGAAIGRGGAQPVIHVENHITVEGGSSGTASQDAALAGRIGQQVTEQVKAVVNNELRLALRPGGMLNPGV
ncbi:hypothetical protein [Azospirillum argentinense]|uniref:tape measure protein n=1 Tax=Azospirillum argentinense TaxID=2970906 RepID=UPI0032DFE73E